MTLCPLQTSLTTVHTHRRPKELSERISRLITSNSAMFEPVRRALHYFDGEVYNVTTALSPCEAGVQVSGAGEEGFNGSL